MLNRIKQFFSKLAPQEVEAFYVHEKEFTEAELNELYGECSMMLKIGVLQKVIDMVVTDSEQKQLYKCTNRPFEITEAELEKQRRGGIADLKSKIQSLASKIPKPKEEFNPNEAI